MKHRVCNTAFSLLLLLPLGCKDGAADKLLLPGGGSVPGILVTYPAQGQSGVNPADEMWVLFTQPMDHQQTESAFTVSSNSGSVPGSFRWEDQKLVFTPAKGLTGTSQFSMVVSRSAENSSGVNLTDDYVVRFYATNDTTQPAFVTSSPQNGATGVSATGDIILTFSKAMDISTALSGISISPSTLVSFIQNTDRSQIIVRPTSPLSNGTYTVNMNTALKDLSGNALQSSAAMSFTVGIDFSPASIVSATSASGTPIALTDGITTNGVDRTSNIVIVFSKPMNRIQTESAISFSPPAANIKSWNAAGDTVTIAFSPFLNSQTTYTVTVNNTALSQTGNALNKNYSYPFVTDASSSIRPVINEVRQFNSTIPGTPTDNALEAATFGAPLVDYSAISLSQEIDENPVVGASTFSIHLRIVFNNPVTLTSVLTNTFFTQVIDPTFGSFQIIGITLNGGSSGTIMTLKLVGNPFPGNQGIPVYKLRLAGGASGVTDTGGNTLATDYLLFVSF